MAVWWSEKYALRLSALAAEVLVCSGKIKERALIPWRESTVPPANRRLICKLTMKRADRPERVRPSNASDGSDLWGSHCHAQLRYRIVRCHLCSQFARIPLKRVLLSHSGEGFFRIFSLRPDRGLMLMTTALPKALATTLMGLTEGEPRARPCQG